MSDLPKRYTAGLKGDEKEAQIKSIKEGRNRPKTSAPTRKSKWTVKAHKRFQGNTSLTNISRKINVPIKGLKEIIDRGEGAYYSSGSRPNVSASQWGKARLYSVLFGGNARKSDADIVRKYKIPLLK